MKVELLWSSPINSSYVAAKRCVSSLSGQELWEKSRDVGFNEMQRFLKDVIMEKGHMQVLEHLVFSFAIDDISRVASHQFVRTRMASMCQQSQRYVDPFEDGFVLPESITEDPSAMIAADDVFQASLHSYCSLVKMGVSTEDARYLLPMASRTSIVVTINASSFLHMIEHRTCMAAQKEYRATAWKMLDTVKKKFPILFEKAGPPCRSKNPRCIGNGTECSKKFNKNNYGLESKRDDYDWRALYDEPFAR